ncbi:MAG TPA: hypothetical protein VJK09_02155 [Candidatus Paceibacterota bacterium]
MENKKPTLREVMGDDSKGALKPEIFNLRENRLMASNLFIEESKHRLENDNFWRNMLDVTDWAMATIKGCKDHAKILAIENLTRDIDDVYHRIAPIESLPDGVREIVAKLILDWTQP